MRTSKSSCGMEALDAPYMEIPFFRMIQKRGGWLAILFLGEMLTATAMSYFEVQIERAVVLALIYSAGHQHRRQLGLAGNYPGHSCDGFGRSTVARLGPSAMA